MGQLSRCRFSPPVRLNACPICSIAWGAWRRRTWLAALATTARPSSLPSRSSASWLIAVSPHQRLRARLGEPGEEAGAGWLPHQKPGLVNQDAAAAERTFERAPDAVERQEQRRRFQPVGQPAEREGDELPLRRGGGRAGEELGVRAGRVGL